MKITVKYFLNEFLKSKPPEEVSPIRSEISDNLDNRQRDKAFPLYIKLTYNRKTTQVRSFILNFFYTIEEAYERYGELLDTEKAMIEHVIAVQVKREGAAFSLKGIPDKLGPYYKHVGNVIKEKLTAEFNEFLATTGSPFAGLLTMSPDRNVDPGIYLHAADRLLLPEVVPEEIKRKIEMLMKMNQIQVRLADLFADYMKFSICCWKFGKGRQYLEEGAFTHGFSVREVKDLLDLVDDEVEDFG